MKTANTEEVKESSGAGGALGGWFCQVSPRHSQRQDEGLTQWTKGHTLEGNTGLLELQNGGSGAGGGG